MPFVCSIVVAQLLISSQLFQFLVVVMVHTRFLSLTPQSQKSTRPSSRSSTPSAATVIVDVPSSSKSRGKKRSMSKNVDDKESKRRKKGKFVDEAPVDTVQKVFFFIYYFHCVTA